MRYRLLLVALVFTVSGCKKDVDAATSTVEPRPTAPLAALSEVLKPAKTTDGSQRRTSVCANLGRLESAAAAIKTAPGQAKNTELWALGARDISTGVSQLAEACRGDGQEAVDEAIAAIRTGSYTANLGCNPPCCPVGDEDCGSSGSGGGTVTCFTTCAQSCRGMDRRHYNLCMSSCRLQCS